jgi:hypothetical protein
MNPIKSSVRFPTVGLSTSGSRGPNAARSSQPYGAPSGMVENIDITGFLGPYILLKTTNETHHLVGF